MKKILIILVFIPLLLFSQTISNQQDKLNIEYLNQLDREIVQLIKLLSAFNSVANGLPDGIEGNNVYKQFLMDVTMECSNIRKQITQLEENSATERELLIRNIITSIKPDVMFVPAPIRNEQAVKNFKLLEIYFNRFLHIQKSLRDSIIDEEKTILESGTISKNYLNLHSRHFLISLINSFIKPSKNLSNKNTFLLLSIANEADTELHQQ